MPPYRPRHLSPAPDVAITAATERASERSTRRGLLRTGALSVGAISAFGAGASMTAATAQAAPTGVLPEKIHGQDVSGWQENIDWAKQKAAGSEFAYIKATEGRTFRNSIFRAQYKGASSAGLIRGGYHFARPDSGDPVEQADFFLNNGGGWTDDGRTLPGMLDLEGYHGIPANYGLSQQEMREWIYAFSTRYRDQTGRRPVIYTNYFWWRDVVGEWTPVNSPLHLAAYRSTVPELIPGRWPTWQMWQYSDQGPFAGDSNVWRGTRKGFERFVASKDYQVDGI